MPDEFDPVAGGLTDDDWDDENNDLAHLKRCFEGAASCTVATLHRDRGAASESVTRVALEGSQRGRTVPERTGGRSAYRRCTAIATLVTAAHKHHNEMKLVLSNHARNAAATRLAAPNQRT